MFTAAHAVPFKVTAKKKKAPYRQTLESKRFLYNLNLVELQYLLNSLVAVSRFARLSSSPLYTPSWPARVSFVTQFNSPVRTRLTCASKLTACCKVWVHSRLVLPHASCRFRCRFPSWKWVKEDYGRVLSIKWRVWRRMGCSVMWCECWVDYYWRCLTIQCTNIRFLRDCLIQIRIIRISQKLSSVRYFNMMPLKPCKSCILNSCGKLCTANCFGFHLKAWNE